MNERSKINSLGAGWLLALIVILAIVFAIVSILDAQETAPPPKFQVDYVLNPEDGLVYYWCRVGCDEFMEYAPLSELSQGFPDYQAANCQLWAWQDAYHNWEGQWETIFQVGQGC